MAIVNSTPPYQQFYDDNGNPLSGGKIFTYTAGTLTPRATYTDQGGLTANSNPVILDSAGRADIWLDNSAAYKFIVKTSTDTTIRTVDNVTPFNTASGLSVLGNIAANTIVGNNTGASAAPTALTATQAQASMINNLSTITIDTATDFIPFYDASGATAGKTLASALGAAATTAQSTPANPTGTSSATQVMMGLAGSITPTKSGKVLIIISGALQNTGGATTNTVQIRYGTGTAPANGAAATGTTAGAALQSAPTNGSGPEAFSINAIVSGLTLSTAHWIDVGLAASAGTGSIRTISISAVEV